MKVTEHDLAVAVRAAYDKYLRRECAGTREELFAPVIRAAIEALPEPAATDAETQRLRRLLPNLAGRCVIERDRAAAKQRHYDHPEYNEGYSDAMIAAAVRIWFEAPHA